MEEAGRAHVDYRFTLANERTYLAYVRTALALLVAGAALLHADRLLGTESQTRPVGVVVMVAGILLTAAGYVRWRQNERRIEAGLALAPTWLPLGLALVLVVLGVVTTVLAVL